MATEFVTPAGEVVDIDALLELNTNVDEALHEVKTENLTLFTWDYERARPALSKLYEKAKTSMWNASTDLDWSIEVDAEKLAAEERDPRFAMDFAGTVLEKLNERELIQLNMESQNWTLSQFLHGEQGALICTAKIVETVPWIDAKYYAATQVMDEARHAEVFGRYLTEKLGGEYPINTHLGALLDDIVADSRWDMTYLGMQIMVEGLALAAFGFIRQMTSEPLLREMLRYIMSDEARHVAFGVLSLREVYAELSEKEKRERQEFAFESALRMRDRFLQQEVWERMGLPVEECVKVALASPIAAEFRRMLFTKIVPNLKKLGLLDGWLREQFGRIGVLQFEDWVDTEEEYETLALVPATA
jgi:para-aminobenzoate N-oxygenase AurF